MKPFGFLCLLLLIGTTALVYLLGYSSEGSTTSYSGSNRMTLIVKSRKLKDILDPPKPDQNAEGHLVLEDYRPIDPSPSSKASVRPGPIQHGTPLMPYIPKPSPPPVRPKRGG